MSGSPTSLFWLPSVRSVGIAAPRTAAVASFVDVLATLPVMPTTSGAKRERQAAATAWRPARASVTRTTVTSPSASRSPRIGSSRHEQRGGPRRRGGGEEAVPVGPLAGQGHEEAAGLHEAGVDGAAPDRAIGAAEERAPRRRDEIVGR